MKALLVTAFLLSPICLWQAASASETVRIATFDVDATPPLGAAMAYDPVKRVDDLTLRCCGIVTLRQQPETANGTTFVSLEDETGVVQVICWKSLRERQRNVLLRSRLLAVHGTWQREGEVSNLIAAQLEDLTPLLGRLMTDSRDFK